MPLCVDRGDAHGVGLGNVGLQRLIEPDLELLDRIGMEILAVEGIFEVFFSEA